MLSQIVFADEHLEGVENTEKNSRLVHVIHLQENGRIGQLSANDVKPVSDFVFDVPAISLPINRSKPSRFAGVVDKSPAANSFREFGP
ncbi:hypothetical protein NUH16_003046 [Penicillium rubens]|nr:hypothetical protein NUH16_003046 [Penicillium rubens]